MIVVDASALAKYLLREEGWQLVRHYLLEEQCITVDHAVKEVLNAVWKAAVARRLITVKEAVEKHDVLQRLIGAGVVAVEPEQVYISEAFRIALEKSITVYDALYIAQAIRRKARLLTADHAQASIAESLGVKAILVP